MYKLTGVTKQYKKGRSTVITLWDADLIIADGEWMAIQGPTGHGETTLLQILGGLDRPTSGTVDFDGRNLSGIREEQVTRVSLHGSGRPAMQSINFNDPKVQKALRPARSPRRKGAKVAADVRALHLA